MFIHSCQWLWSAQALKSNSQAGGVFSHSCQWLWSAQTLERNSQAGGVFQVSHSCQWLRSLKHWRATHTLERCSAVLVSGSDLLKHLRGTHKLEGCSAILISGSDLLKHLRGTHKLEKCLVILVSGSDHTGEGLTSWRGVQPFLSVTLICWNTGEKLTSWRGIQPFLSVALICWNTGEGLTCWKGVQPFLSVALIFSNTGEGLTHWRVFSHSCQWLWSAETLEWDSHSGGCSTILISGSDLLKLWRGTHTLEGCSAVLVSGSNLLQCWRVTHILEGCSAILISSDVLKTWWGAHFLDVYLISKIHVNCLLSYWFILQKKKHLSGFNNLCQGIPHTYCKHSISLIFSTRYCAHILNHMSISDSTGLDYCSHIALFLLSGHSSETNINNDYFKRWHILTICLLALTGIYSLKSKYSVRWIQSSLTYECPNHIIVSHIIISWIKFSLTQSFRLLWWGQTVLMTPM